MGTALQCVLVRVASRTLPLSSCPAAGGRPSPVSLRPPTCPTLRWWCCQALHCLAFSPWQTQIDFSRACSGAGVVCPSAVSRLPISAWNPIKDPFTIPKIAEPRQGWWQIPLCIHLGFVFFVTNIAFRGSLSREVQLSAGASAAVSQPPLLKFAERY